MADQDYKRITTTTRTLDPTNVTQNGLQQTMTGGNLAPPDLSPTTDDSAVQQAMGRLNEILAAQPNIDYNQKYLDLINEVQNTPTTPNPLSTPGGVASSFAFALGAPQTAPALIREKIAKSAQEEEKKRDELFDLKKKIVEGTIQQELTQGNFKGALKQYEVLDQIERAKADRKRAQDIADWKTKQQIKTTDAQTLLKKKVEEITSSFHLPERLKLQLFTIAGNLLTERMRQRDLLGEPVQDIPSEALINEILPALEETARKLAGNTPLSTGKTETPPATTPPPVSPLTKALQEIRQGKK